MKEEKTRWTTTFSFSCDEDTLLLPMAELDLWHTILKYATNPEMYPLKQDEDE